MKLFEEAVMREKIQNRAVRAFVAAVIMTLISGAVIYAADWETDRDNEASYGMLDDIAGGDDIQKALDNVTVNLGEDGVDIGGYHVQGLTGIVTGVNEYMQGLAFIIVIMSFVIGVASMRSQDMTAEEIARRAVLAFIALGFIFYSLKLCFLLANIGSDVARKVVEVNGTLIETDTTLDTVKQIIYEDTHREPEHEAGIHISNAVSFIGTQISNLSARLSIQMQLGLPWFALKIANIVVTVICWGRALEIIILSAFSPFAFADMAAEGFQRSSGERFIKNFAALSLSGAVIAFALIMCGRISAVIIGNVAATGSFTDFTRATWNLVVIGFVEAGLVSRAQSISRTFCGV